VVCVLAGALAVGRVGATPDTAIPLPAEPQIPKRTSRLADFGAIGDGHALNTQAFKDVIEACVEGEGGCVVVPTGVWLTGPIHLRNKVRLHLEKGAEVRFSDRPEHCLPVVLIARGGVRCMNCSPLIYARDCEDIAITGKGTLNGQGQAWWSWINRQPGMSAMRKAVRNGVPVERRVYGRPEDGVCPPFIQSDNWLSLGENVGVDVVRQE
jgi:hypothetical protein